MMSASEPVDFRAQNLTTLTFDCYGTLVDWERGACTALRALLPSSRDDIADEDLIRGFLEADQKLTARGIMPYAEVLAQAAREAFARHGLLPDRRKEEAFAGSVAAWPLFEETNPSLVKLSRRYRLAIISNIDEALIQGTLKLLTTSFALVMTSERARSYKPSEEIFRQTIRELREPPERVLHVAEGLCEARPARALGMRSVWVRRSDRSDDGSGADPQADRAHKTFRRDRIAQSAILATRPFRHRKIGERRPTEDLAFPRDLKNYRIDKPEAHRSEPPAPPPPRRRCLRGI